MIEKLLLTVMVANPKWLDPKKKPVIYTRAFVEIYNKHNCRLVYKTHGMVELKKYPISKTKNFLNLGAYRFYKISLILRIAYIVPRDNEGNVFYVKNYINWD